LNEKAQRSVLSSVFTRKCNYLVTEQTIRTLVLTSSR